MTEEADDMCVCPYNRSHMVSYHKLPNHLVKCRKNNPEIAKNMEICPYNQCHHVPKEALAEHFQTCKEYHVFQSLSIKPSTVDRVPHRPLKNVDMMEQEQLNYQSYRSKFSKPPKAEDPAEVARQHQQNLDDLDEWFVE